MSAPLLPLGHLASAQVSPALYARAVGFLSAGAYFSPGYLMSSLDVTEETGKVLLSRLRADGLIGGAEKSGFLFSKTFYAEQGKATALALQKAASAKAQAVPEGEVPATRSDIEITAQDAGRCIDSDIERCEVVENTRRTQGDAADQRPDRLS